MICLGALHLSGFRLIGFLLVLLACSACDNGFFQESKYSVDSIRKQGELVVLTRNAPTVYFIDREGIGAGVDHDLIMSFAEQHNLTVRFEVRDTVEEVIADLKAGRGHIAAAGLTDINVRNHELLASTPYQQVSQQVVCRRGGEQPKNVDALPSVNLTVIAESSYVSQLELLKQDYPDLQWQTENNMDTEALLEKVWQKEIDCTLADSNIVAVNRRYHPELVTTFDLVTDEPLVWYLPNEAEPLKSAVDDWLDEYRESGELDALLERYYGYIEIFDYVDTRKYIDRIRKRLPKYKQMFEAASEKYELPWTLLAAQSYQESHWNRRAKSPTGVRGMMMLTLGTAKELGVKSRLDARQSIFGGARYLDQLRQRLPEEIQEPDRTWFALAAYNVGMGHVHDARTLAQQLDKDPNTWAGLKEVLPLLAQKKYYKSLKYGYARGHEPVLYVTRIRNFEDILQQQDGNLAVR